MPRLLQAAPFAVHALASRLDRIGRSSEALSRPAGLPARVSATLRAMAASWPEPGSPTGPVSWPDYPVHGQGNYAAQVAILPVDAASVAATLPPELALGPCGGSEGTHPVILFLGRQTDVRPNIFPAPGMGYDEAIFAVPNVFAPDATESYQGPFAFMPRLWLDDLPPVLIGLLFYGYAKRLASIGTGASGYQVHSLEDGALLASAQLAASGAAGPPASFPAWRDIDALLHQPLIAEPVPGVEIGSVLNFRTHHIHSLEPLSGSVSLGPAAVPGFPGGTFQLAGLGGGGLPAAFRMVSSWRLTPPMPRHWFRSGGAAAPSPAPAGAVAGLPWAPPRKRKVAVLGGGVGALCAAWELTSSPNWQEQFDITVHQLGWRLGGKGASGRNAALGQRIEEHGLHIWAGFYENAFRVMRECYAELGRPPGTPLATVDGAFKPHQLVTLQEERDGAWTSWNIETPLHPGVPGEGAAPAVPQTPAGYLPALLAGMTRLTSRAPPALRTALATTPVRLDPALRAGVARARRAGHAAPPPHPAAGLADSAPKAGPSTVLDDALAVARHATADPGAAPRQMLTLLRTARAVQAAPDFARQLSSPDDQVRRIAELISLGLATVAGIIGDGLIFRGFAAADGDEWRDWLRRHGAAETALASAAVRGTYDYVFGFLGGDTSRPALAAGTTTHGVLRLLLTYKGALFWAMQAGMGDTAFTPLYQALRRRGVKFRFFHKVERLGLDARGHRIERIEIARQAALKDPTQEYEPLVDVLGLQCWPSQPRFDQLVNGEQLRESGVDIEHAPSPIAPDPPTMTLRRGEDFDEVVLGISLGGLPAISGELAVASPRWRRMLETVRTVATLGVQLWMRPDLEGLGWTAGRTIATAYTEPLDTWADMDWLLPREDWPPGADGGPPRSVNYLCGPLADGATTEDVKALARTWLKTSSHHLWPKVSTPDGGLDLGQLYDPAGGDGEVRFQAQYFRANTAGSERYVQSVPGSTAARLRPDESGFDNLVLAGDWVRNSMSAGCVEGAAMGGIAAAAAISGRAAGIVGDESAPLAAGLAEHLADLVHATAHTEALILVANVAMGRARRLLPGGLELTPQFMTPKGRYPLALIFARQRNLRLNVSPVGVDGREFTLMLPSVRAARSPGRATPEQVASYAPRRWFDHPLLALGARLGYGQDARRATMAFGSDRLAVRAGLGAATIAEATVKPAGDVMELRASGHAGDVAWLLQRPALGRSPFGGWRLAQPRFGLDQAWVQPVEASLIVGQSLRPFLGPALPQDAKTGFVAAFRLWTESAWSNPLVGLAPWR